MIAQLFGYHKEFYEEAEYRPYFRLSTIPCGIKEQARARQSGEICGLAARRALELTRPFLANRLDGVVEALEEARAILVGEGRRSTGHGAEIAKL